MISIHTCHEGREWRFPSPFPLPMNFPRRRDDGPLSFTGRRVLCPMALTPPDFPTFLLQPITGQLPAPAMNPAPGAVALSGAVSDFSPVSPAGSRRGEEEFPPGRPEGI